MYKAIYKDVSNVCTNCEYRFSTNLSTSVSTPCLQVVYKVVHKAVCNEVHELVCTTLFSALCLSCSASPMSAQTVVLPCMQRNTRARSDACHCASSIAGTANANALGTSSSFVATLSSHVSASCAVARQCGKFMRTLHSRVAFLAHAIISFILERTCQEHARAYVRNVQRVAVRRNSA